MQRLYWVLRENKVIKTNEMNYYLWGSLLVKPACYTNVVYPDYKSA